MSNSLQDQLLSKGLVDQKKLKKHQRDKRKQAKQQGKGQEPVDDIKLAAQQARAQQAERDRQRNLELHEKAQQKAIAAQIQQLIASHRIPHSGDVAYQFVDGGKIKKLQVSELLQRQLARGQIAIVQGRDGYQLIPAKIAAKIAERDAEAIVVLHRGEKDAVEDDDPYADYPIPDDLMW